MQLGSRHLNIINAPQSPQFLKILSWRLHFRPLYLQTPVSSKKRVHVQKFKYLLTKFW